MNFFTESSKKNFVPLSLDDLAFPLKVAINYYCHNKKFIRHFPQCMMSPLTAGSIMTDRIKAYFVIIAFRD